MNIDAPIVPGESAAGIQSGSLIEELLNGHTHSFDSGEVVKPSFPTLVKTRYRSAMVDVWVRKGKIDTKPYDAETQNRLTSHPKMGTVYTTQLHT